MVDGVPGDGWDSAPIEADSDEGIEDGDSMDEFNSEDDDADAEKKHPVGILHIEFYLLVCGSFDRHVRKDRNTFSSLSFSILSNILLSTFVYFHAYTSLDNLFIILDNNDGYCRTFDSAGVYTHVAPYVCLIARGTNLDVSKLAVNNSTGNSSNENLSKRTTIIAAVCGSASAVLLLIVAYFLTRWWRRHQRFTKDAVQDHEAQNMISDEISRAKTHANDSSRKICMILPPAYAERDSRAYRRTNPENHKVLKS